MSGTKTASPETLPFEADAQAVLARVRNAFAAILDSLPGHVSRAHEVSKALGVHKKLGWQIANLVYEADSFAAAQHIPGRASVKRFLEAAARRDVSPNLLQSAEAAMADFDRLTKVHAGDRESLDLMLTGCAGDASFKAHLTQRKAWFGAASYLCGVQAKTRVTTFFVYPSPRPDMFDVSYLNGYLRLRRMRAHAQWEITRSRAKRDDGSEPSQPRREPLDADLANSDWGGKPPLVARFCSQPVPRVVRQQLADGWVMDMLADGGVGDTATVDCFTGEILHEVLPRYRTEHDWLWCATATMRTPCELLVLDQFVHEDLFGPIRPGPRIYSNLIVPPSTALPRYAEEDRLPVYESVQHLGKGLAGIRTPDVPRYAQMVRSTFERLGLDPTKFDLYRLRVAYPPLPTRVTMENPLPEPPNQSPERQQGAP